jgi:glycosyltransferase 2 family protein
MRRFGRLALQVGLGSAISIACLLLVLRFVDIDQVSAVLSRTKPSLLAVAVAAIMADVLLRAWRWRVLVAPLAVVPIGRVMAYLLLGYLANNVLPGRAGELVRSHYLGDREGTSRVSVLGSVLVERIVDVVALLLISVAAWWFTGAAPSLAGLLAFGLVGGAAAVAVVVAVIILPGRDRFIPWLSARLPISVTGMGGRLRAGFLVVLNTRTLGFAAVLTLCAWATTAVVFAAAAGAVGFEISPAQILLIAAATNLATAIPSAPGYVGTFEFAVVATAGAVGLATAPALAMGVLVHVAILLTTSVGGLAAMWLVTYRRQWRLSEPVIASDESDGLAEIRRQPPPD